MQLFMLLCYERKQYFDGNPVVFVYYIYSVLTSFFFFHCFEFYFIFEFLEHLYLYQLCFQKYFFKNHQNITLKFVPEKCLFQLVMT